MVNFVYSCPKTASKASETETHHFLLLAYVSKAVPHWDRYSFMWNANVNRQNIHAKQK